MADPERLPDQVALGQRHAAELHVLRDAAQVHLERRVVPEHLLDRGVGELGAFAQERELLGMPHQRAHAQRDQSRRRLVAAEEQRDRGAQQLRLGQAAALELGGDQGAQQVVPRLRASLLEQADGSSSRASRMAAFASSPWAASTVPPRKKNELIRHVQSRKRSRSSTGKPGHLGDDDRRQGIREVADELDAPGRRAARR